MGTFLWRSLDCTCSCCLDSLLLQIRVNSVNPTVTLTPLAKRYGWENPAKASRITDNTPLGQLAGNAMSE